MLKMSNYSMFLDNIKYTRISGRYAPLILAPAESSTLEPCIVDFISFVIQSVNSFAGLLQHTQDFSDSKNYYLSSPLPLQTVIFLYLKHKMSGHVFRMCLHFL